MDHEDYEPQECDHDDDVQCTHLFFSWSTQGHLARRKLVNAIKARTHWVIAVTPECLSRGHALVQLHQEDCGDRMSMIVIRDLNPTPVVYVLPKDCVSFYDLVSVVTELAESREAVEGRDWILLTSAHSDAWTQAIERWITTDNLLN
jgi:hypothetical protein